VTRPSTSIFAYRAVERLGAAGVPVVYREYPITHEVSLESMQDAMAWLALGADGERPVGAVPDFAANSGSDDGLCPRYQLSFDREVLKSQMPVIVDLLGPWCEPCRLVAPVLEEIAAMARFPTRWSSQHRRGADIASSSACRASR